MNSNRTHAITSSGKPAYSDRRPPQPPPGEEQRPWPYDPPEDELLQWCNTALNHYLAIRATGSVPEIGGPSFPLQLPTTTSGIQQCAEAAEDWWPNARSFDIVGGDLEYKQQGDITDDEGMAPGMNRLRNAVLITTFSVTDRPAVVPPSPRSAPPAEPAEAPPAETSLSPNDKQDRQGEGADTSARPGKERTPAATLKRHRPRELAAISSGPGRQAVPR